MNDILIIIICFVNLFLWIFLFFYFRKKFSSEQILENIRQEVDKLLIEISRETDQDLNLIEDKMNDLENLLDEAEDRISAIRLETDGIKLQPRREPAGEPEKPVQPVRQEIKLFPARKVNTEPTEIEVPEQPPVIQAEPEVQDSPAKEVTLKDKVLDLWRLGFDSERISEKLGVSLTEIQMIIDMYG